MPRLAYPFFSSDHIHIKINGETNQTEATCALVFASIEEFMAELGAKLWEPSPERREASQMQRFMRAAANIANRSLTNFSELHRWSIEEPAAFWRLVAKETGVRWQRQPDTIYTPPPAGKMLGGTWFHGAQLNFAENLLPPPLEQEVLVSVAEGREEPRRYSARELHNEVARCAAALKAAGIGKGDRVAGVVANVAEALIAMLATTSLGAIWASCSPDFGAAAIVDRFAQIEPKLVFFTSAYVYAGRQYHNAATIAACLERLPSVRKAVLIDHLGLTREGTWQEFLASALPAPKGKEVLPLAFTPTSFSHPVYILFSSGTTGAPKCIVHSAGGTLLQHKKELSLHGDLGAGSRLLFYTTCGWMMWNWTASALATGASLVLFEGSVAKPDLGVLWRTLAQEKVSAFGTSPKFLATCMQEHLDVKGIAHLAALTSIFSTGAPLLPEQFAWVYDCVKADVHLASISGGTDIVSCFMLGNPLEPVYAGEIQGPGLGMAIEAWDETGRQVGEGKGELVCTKPFPAMPVGFWQDPSGERYRKAYFTHYPSREVWRHGDFVEFTRHGGVVVYGRSDATLNPGGVRIGTAEIYRQVEAIAEVTDSIAIGLRDGGDTRIVLFVKLRPGQSLSEGLSAKIKAQIRGALTPRHVPAVIKAVADIPYTRSGKKVEIAVTQAVHGEPVANRNALANPESLTEYEQIGKEWKGT